MKKGYSKPLACSRRNVGSFERTIPFPKTQGRHARICRFLQGPVGDRKGRIILNAFFGSAEVTRRGSSCDENHNGEFTGRVSPTLMSRK
ncbi:hypothetical protein DB347_20390 [Opitutaceae bacterium EW11]|nr:hypothetical protein DB347_20390 [Opitutaceae bacterium EW11]